MVLLRHGWYQDRITSIELHRDGYSVYTIPTHSIYVRFREDKNIQLSARNVPSVSGERRRGRGGGGEEVAA